MGWLKSAFDPRIRAHLLREEDEVIIDDVHHHWVVYIVPVLEACLGAAILFGALYVPFEVAWFPMLLALAIALHGGWKAVNEYMDRFVITNMRVFRIRGVLSQTLATMPLGRILDITVEKPFWGRFVNYGHFVFESAAQEQGLRDIRYVGRPYERDLVIQRVVQKAGLRGPRLGR